MTAQELRQTRKKIGMIFQHFNLIPSRTVAGNIAFPVRGSVLSKKEAAGKVTRLLKHLNETLGITIVLIINKMMEVPMNAHRKQIIVNTACCSCCLFQSDGRLIVLRTAVR